jgi:thiamine-phosphate pyrophosphorylase
MPFRIPKIYPILDSSILPPTGRAEALRRLGESLAESGVTLLEYRNKVGGTAEIFRDAPILRAAMRKNIKLILDDRVDLIDQIDFDGVHVDAGDLSPAAARARLGADRLIGTFGGSGELVQGILAAPADYLSIGPVFRTQTKETTKPPIGPEGVARLRSEAGPGPVLVAVGGITLETARDVLAAGADTVAVSAAIFRAADPAAEFRRWKAELG